MPAKLNFTQIVNCDILYALIIKLTKRREGGFGEGGIREGEIVEGETEEGGCEETFLCFSLT